MYCYQALDGTIEELQACLESMGRLTAVSVLDEAKVFRKGVKGRCPSMLDIQMLRPGGGSLIIDQLCNYGERSVILK